MSKLLSYIESGIVGVVCVVVVFVVVVVVKNSHQQQRINHPGLTVFWIVSLSLTSLVGLGSYVRCIYSCTNMEYVYLKRLQTEKSENGDINQDVRACGKICDK